MQKFQIFVEIYNFLFFRVMDSNEIHVGQNTITINCGTGNFYFQPNESKCKLEVVAELKQTQIVIERCVEQVCFYNSVAFISISGSVHQSRTASSCQC
jgi:hypothetical protein